MILRILNLAVIGALVLAAAYVYRVKFESTVQAERLARMRSEVRRARDSIATLREEWSELSNPARIEALSKRYLQLKPIAPIQFDKLDRLPDHPPDFIKPDSKDPIGVMIENLEEPETITGSIPAPAVPAAAPAEGAAPDVDPTADTRTDHPDDPGDEVPATRADR